MGYITIFNIMILSLLSMQFAICSAINGTMSCFVLHYSSCYQETIAKAILQQCKDDEAIQCLKNSADQCNVDNPTEANATEFGVGGMEHVLADICKTGTDMNTALLKHKECVFGIKIAESSEQCSQEQTKGMKNELTGNTEKDQEIGLKFFCKYSDEIKKCVNTKVKEICGEDAQSFHHKLNDPSKELHEKVCNSSPAQFGLFWTLLLQASAILMSLEYFWLTK